MKTLQQLIAVVAETLARIGQARLNPGLRGS
jgi:hypothetical protein